MLSAWAPLSPRECLNGKERNSARSSVVRGRSLHQRAVAAANTPQPHVDQVQTAHKATSGVVRVVGALDAAGMAQVSEVRQPPDRADPPHFAPDTARSPFATTSATVLLSHREQGRPRWRLVETSIPGACPPAPSALQQHHSADGLFRTAAPTGGIRQWASPE